MRQNINLGACGRNIRFEMELNPHDPSELFMLQHFVNNQCYEPELAWIMFRVLTEGSFAVDVGANIGFFTLLMSKLVGPDGCVFSCEPGSNTLPALRNNLIINAVSNTKVVDRPIWCREEEVTFYLNADNSGGNALFDPANWPSNTESKKNPQYKSMQATTLDTLLPQDIWPVVKLIKIDTEGAEQRILEGAQNLLKICRPPFILAEMNPHGLEQSGCSEDTLRAFMRTFGYDAFVVHNSGSLPALVPHDTRFNRKGDHRISNMMFSDIPNVAAAWPEVHE